MRVGSLRGRAALFIEETAVDVATASAGRFGPDVMQCYDEWDEFSVWAAGVTQPGEPYDRSQLDAPAPRPRQVFAIGMNYASHAAESGTPNPEFPPTFTKFPSCLTGPFATVDLPSAGIDYEVELVAVLSRAAWQVSAADAWSYVAGLTIGQDLSHRAVQLRPPVPQFSLGKSFPGAGPMGPWVVSVDELAHPDDLALSTTIGDEVLQQSRTSDLIFSVPKLIECLSGVAQLLPGDVIFTGTPSGVGIGRTPPRFLRAGDELVSEIEGIGSIVTTFTGGE